jgi:hypothetical protein
MCVAVKVPLPYPKSKKGKGKAKGKRDIQQEGQQGDEDGAPVLTMQNRKQYVELYCRRRYLPPGMRASVLALRRGLLRVIPQDLINIMSGPHIGSYVLVSLSMSSSSPSISSPLSHFSCRATWRWTYLTCI